MTFKKGHKGFNKKNPLITKEEITVVESVTKEEVSDLPILTSVGVAKVNEHYVSYIIKTQGNLVVDAELETNDMKMVAVSNAKINFNKQFLLQDLE